MHHKPSKRSQYDLWKGAKVENYRKSLGTKMRNLNPSCFVDIFIQKKVEKMNAQRKSSIDRNTIFFEEIFLFINCENKNCLLCKDL